MIIPQNNFKSLNLSFYMHVLTGRINMKVRKGVWWNAAFSAFHSYNETSTWNTSAFQYIFPDFTCIFSAWKHETVLHLNKADWPDPSLPWRAGTLLHKHSSCTACYSQVPHNVVLKHSLWLHHISWKEGVQSKINYTTNNLA